MNDICIPKNAKTVRLDSLPVGTIFVYKSETGTDLTEPLMINRKEQLEGKVWLNYANGQYKGTYLHFNKQVYPLTPTAFGFNGEVIKFQKRTLSSAVVSVDGESRLHIGCKQFHPSQLQEMKQILEDWEKVL